MDFKASMDKTTIVITVIITTLFAAIIISQFLIEDAGHETQIFTTAACLTIYFLSYGFSPNGYTVTREELIVRRPFRDVRIKRTEIDSVAAIETKILRRSLRTFGVGGLFGYFGKFYNSSVGHMTWYATSRHTPVLITTVSKRKIVVTPDEPERMLAALQG